MNSLEVNSKLKKAQFYLGINMVLIGLCAIWGLSLILAVPMVFSVFASYSAISEVIADFKERINNEED
jgi:hypothetical protein